MARRHRVVATVGGLGLAVLLGLVASACGPRDGGIAAQVQPVATAAATGVPKAAAQPTPTFRPHPELIVGTLVPYETSTPAPYVAPPTPDPRTPPLPTSIPTHLVPARFPTARPPITPAPSHTPGPTPTNPPGEEPALRQTYQAAHQARLARVPQSRLAISGIRIEGDWAVIDVYFDSPGGTGGGLAIARKLNNRWQVAFIDEPVYHDWLEAMPDSLLTPQDRRLYH